jgi:ABC-type transport system involved in multi-copper enzyme maturation permease subunit
MSGLRATLAWLLSRQGLGLLLLLAGLAGLIHFGGRLPFAAQAALWLGLGLGLALFLRPLARKVFGPVFFYELVRTTRTGRYAQLRCLYAGILLAGMSLLYASWFGLASLQPQQFFRPPQTPFDDLPQFAGSFFRTFFLIQYLAVLLATPVFTAGAIAEDRERGTLDLLFTTHLSDGEIVLGKLAARLAHLTLLLVAGLPILGLAQFLGGIDPNWVLGGFAATLATMLSMGSLGLVASIRSPRTIDALTKCYRWAFGYLTLGACIPVVNLGNPLTVLILVSSISGFLPGAPALLIGSLYAVVHLLMAAALCGGAFRDLRALRQGGPASRAGLVTGNAASRTAAQGVPFRPPIGDQPMMWKELYTSRSVQGIEWGGMAGLGPILLGALCFFMLLGVSALISAGNSRQEAINRSALFISIPLILLLLSQVAVNAAGSISREVESGTLESLLTTPLERSEILWAKLCGSLRQGRSLAIFLALIWAATLITGGLSLVGVLLLPAGIAVYAGFTACLGLFLSLTCGSTLRATLWVVLVLVAVNLFPLLLPDAWAVVLSPPASLVSLCTLPSGRTTLFPPWTAFQTRALFGIMVYLAGAAIMWRLTLLRFQERYGEAPAAKYRAMAAK